MGRSSSSAKRRAPSSPQGEADTHKKEEEQGSSNSRYLFRITEIPRWLRYNRWIHTGYRKPNSTVLEALSSLFYLHNETINVWSHLVPCLICLWLLVFNPLPLQDDPTGSSIMFSFAFVFGFSAAYHLFMPCCSSQKSYSDLLCVDVLGSLLAMVTSSYSFLLYGNRCFPETVRFYMSAAVTLYGLFLVYVIKFNHSMSPLRRVLTFATLIVIRGAFGVWSVHYKVSELGLWTGAKYHVVAFLVLLIGAIFNVTRIPERLFSPPAVPPPDAEGKSSDRAPQHSGPKGAPLSSAPLFWLTDYAFNSHNIWHFFCVVAILCTGLGCHYDRVEYEVQAVRCG